MARPRSLHGCCRWRGILTRVWVRQSTYPSQVYLRTVTTPSAKRPTLSSTLRLNPEGSLAERREPDRLRMCLRLAELPDPLDPAEMPFKPCLPRASGSCASPSQSPPTPRLGLSADLSALAFSPVPSSMAPALPPPLKCYVPQLRSAACRRDRNSIGLILPTAGPAESTPHTADESITRAYSHHRRNSAFGKASFAS